VERARENDPTMRMAREALFSKWRGEPVEKGAINELYAEG